MEVHITKKTEHEGESAEKKKGEEKMKRMLLALATLVLISMLTVVGFALPELIFVPWRIAPTVDGIISPREYIDANSVTFATSGGTCTVYFKHDGTTLYVAFDVPNADINTPAPEVNSSVQVFIDALNDKASLPQTDDWRFTISLRTKPLDDVGENQGTGVGWSGWRQPVGWSYAWQVWNDWWTAEFAIPFGKLGITVGDTIGIAFCNAWTHTGDHYWPSGADWLDPSTWGTGYINPRLVGGVWVAVDKLGLLAPYIGLASTIVVAAAATAIYVKRVKPRKKKQ